MNTDNNTKNNFMLDNCTVEYYDCNGNLVPYGQIEPNVWYYVCGSLPPTSNDCSLLISNIGDCDSPLCLIATTTTTITTIPCYCWVVTSNNPFSCGFSYYDCNLQQQFALVSSGQTIYICSQTQPRTGDCPLTVNLIGLCGDPNCVLVTTTTTLPNICYFIEVYDLGFGGFIVTTDIFGNQIGNIVLPSNSPQDYFLCSYSTPYYSTSGPPYTPDILTSPYYLIVTPVANCGDPRCSPPTTTTTTLYPLCNCQCYLFQNIGTTDASISYTDCNGQINVDQIPVLGANIVCVSRYNILFGQVEVIASGEPCYDIGGNECVCLNAPTEYCMCFLIEYAVGNGSVAYQYTPCGGSFTQITINGPTTGQTRVCSYQNVPSYVLGSAVGQVEYLTVTFIGGTCNSQSDCNDIFVSTTTTIINQCPCFCVYANTVSMTASSIIDYTNCDGIRTTLTIPYLSPAITFCAKQVWGFQSQFGLIVEIPTPLVPCINGMNGCECQ